MKNHLGARRRKTFRVAAALEEKFGAPVPSRRRCNPLDVLIETILSQNTSDLNSERAYRQLRKKYTSWKKLLRAPVRSIASAIRAGGLAQQKSKRIKRILTQIDRERGKPALEFLGRLSSDDAYEYLHSMNGVGPKTAACVLLFALRRDVFPVDTHIHRLCGRLGLTSATSNPEETFHEMKKLVPRGKAYSLHINLIRFGRDVCRSQKPLCSRCVLYDECLFSRKEHFAALPAGPLPGRTRYSQRILWESP